MSPTSNSKQFHPLSRPIWLRHHCEERPPGCHISTAMFGQFPGVGEMFVVPFVRRELFQIVVARKEVWSRQKASQDTWFSSSCPHNLRQKVFRMVLVDGQFISRQFWARPRRRRVPGSWQTCGGRHGFGLYVASRRFLPKIQ